MNTEHFVSRIGIMAVLVVLVLGFTAFSAGATAAGTTFTYQGQLSQGGSAYTGSCNFQFGLWDDPSTGSQVGSTLTLPGVTVTNGLFTVQLDFGAGAFTGEARWLEIAVECGSDTQYTTLAPRQALTPAPYALYAHAAGNAKTVTNGVYITGSYSDPAWLTALAGSKISGPVASATNATTVTNGVYTTGSYTDPGWLTALAGSKISGPVASATNAATVTNGVYTTGSYTDPGWLTALAGSKITGTVASATNAATVTNGVYTTGSYSNPSWLTGLAGGKVTGTVASATTATNFSGNLAGDVTGTQGATSVTRLRGFTLASTAPANGQVLQYDGAQWAPASALAAFWSLTGNSGTNPATNFLGTLDNVALEIRVYNSRALRLEPNATSPNIIGGYNGNTVTGGVYGAVIGGGGESGFLNRVTDNYGVVGGGSINQAGDDAGITSDKPYATVGGGYDNIASGYSATVGGGDGNAASGYSATVGGGEVNRASYDHATVGGGGNNTASNSYATVGGGFLNTASVPNATVGGGWDNAASGQEATVGGGDTNTASGQLSTVAGGWYAAATHFGEMAHASGLFSGIGDAQASEYVLRKTTTNDVQTELFLDGSYQRLTLASNRTLTFDILIVAHSDTDASAGYEIKGLIENVGGTTAFVGSPTVTVLGEDVPAWDAVAVADDTNDALSIWVTGATGTTIRWVASVRTVEVGW